MSAAAAAGFSSAQRCFMFYAICIPLRLALTAVVYHVGSDLLVRSAAVVAGVATYFLNSKRIREAREGEVWWHRPVHMLTGILVAISFLISPATKLPSALLLTDTLFGLATSLYKQPFK